jgi:hypothetical protein
MEERHDIRLKVPIQHFGLDVQERRERAADGTGSFFSTVGLLPKSAARTPTAARC